MTLAYVLNEDYVVQYTLDAPTGDLVSGTGGIVNASTTGVASFYDNYVRIDGKKAMRGHFWTAGHIGNWTGGAVTCPYSSMAYWFVSGLGYLVKNTIKTKFTGVETVTDICTGPCEGTWALKVYPNTVLPCACTVTVVTAGQNKVMAD